MAQHFPYFGTRILEITGGIAGSYCGKMFVDAGADVVKIEPRMGDPLRSRDGGGCTPGATSPLFEYLNANKRSVVDSGAVGEEIITLFRSADIIILDGSGIWDVAAVLEVLPENPSTVIVSITPFGTAGPYVDQGVLANEFILQALCGSIGSRGWPNEMPLQAGGRIGEWVAGTYSAVAAAAALRQSHTTGHGEIVDVSAYECMVVTMGGLGAVAASVMKDRMPSITRSFELPSIVPTSDGLVGFCTITAQQFADFLILIDRPDLLDDTDLASAVGRVRRRAEFLGIVHSWAAERTTAEILELAAALRIPVAPIGTPTTVTEIDHFRERGVFVENTAGRLQPRVPYRSEAFETRTLGPAPLLGADTGTVGWLPKRTYPVTTAPQVNGPTRPLAGVRIADFTAFWAGPSATQTLAALGAEVVKIEGLSRPDGMRFSGGLPASVDKWWEWGSVFLASNSNKSGVTLELGRPQGRELALELVSQCDLVIENFSPRVMDNFRLGWDEISSTNPRTSMIRMPAFGLDGPWRDRVGFAQTMEQASGMAWMTGMPDGLPVIPRGVCDPIAGLHAAFAAIAALEVRDLTGSGLHVESTMVEATLNVAAEAMLEASVSAAEPRREGNRGPGASPQGVYLSAEDDEWVALAVLNHTQWIALAILLERPDLAEEPGLADENGRRARADDLDKVITEWVSKRGAHETVQLLRDRGIAAARVNSAQALLDDEQLRARKFWEPMTHPVVGTFLTAGMPFKFASIDAEWNRTPAPLLGQHNRQVLGTLASRSAAEMDALEQRGIIGNRPAGL